MDPGYEVASEARVGGLGHSHVDFCLHLTQVDPIYLHSACPTQFTEELLLELPAEEARFLQMPPYINL